MTTTLLSALFYTDTSQFVKEQHAILSKNWLILGHVDMVAAGQVVAQKVGMWSILLARDPNGVLRAFHNVCRHRAGPLAWVDSPAESCPRIRCKYHGWSYDWEGRL